jgi:hypothetical protein
MTRHSLPAGSSARPSEHAGGADGATSGPPLPPPNLPLARHALDASAETSALTGDLYKRSRATRRTTLQLNSLAGSGGGFSRWEYRHVVALSGYCLYYRSEFEAKPQNHFSLASVRSVRMLPAPVHAPLRRSSTAASATGGAGAADSAAAEVGGVGHDGAGSQWSFEVCLSDGKQYQFAAGTLEQLASWVSLFAGIAQLNSTTSSEVVA